MASELGSHVRREPIVAFHSSEERLRLWLKAPPPFSTPLLIPSPLPQPFKRGSLAPFMRSVVLLCEAFQTLEMPAREEGNRSRHPMWKIRGIKIRFKAAGKVELIHFPTEKALVIHCSSYCGSYDVTSVET